MWKHPATAVDGLLCFRHYYTGIAPPDKILKATAIFYADLDVFPSGKEYIYIFLYSLWISKHSNFVFCEVSLHIFYHWFIHHDFASSFRLFDYIHYTCWVLETGPKKAYSLNKSNVYFGASTDSHHHWTENVCIISLQYLLLLLCMMDSIILATMYLENLSKFCIILQRKSECLKIVCLLSILTANMHKKKIWIKQIHSYCMSTEGWSDVFSCQFLL